MKKSNIFVPRQIDAAARFLRSQKAAEFDER